MPIGRSDLRAGLLAATALLVLPLAACGDDDPPPSSDPDQGVTAAIEDSLGQRARALRTANRKAFERGVFRRDYDFESQQSRYFDNLAQLPIETLRYRVDPATLQPEENGRGYWIEVVLSLQLDGYDAVPVEVRDRYLFRRAGYGERYLLASTTDPDWEKTHLDGSQPWDLDEIEVRQNDGVLGVFDSTTIDDAGTVLDSVASAVREVGDVVPDDDGLGVVVYAVSDPSFVNGIASIPIEDPSQLDAVTVPIPLPEGSSHPEATYRILLSDQVLWEDRVALDRLVRHEITHVVLGDRGRGAPLWLVEGIAEYVSVRPMPLGSRPIPPSALDLARSGVTALPEASDFAGADAPAYYSLSWWICEFIAANYGESTLFWMLDESALADQETVIRDILGMSPEELVIDGTGLMRATYG